MNQQSTPRFDDIQDLPEQAVRLAAEILNGSRQRETREERARSAKMARMMRDENGKKFTIAMADQVLRIKSDAAAARRMHHLIQQYGLPRYFSGIERTQLKLGDSLGSLAPGIVMPMVKRKVRSDSAHVIISADPQKFARYLERRRRDQIRINFNQLGEAVLGEQEANRRRQAYLDRLKSNQIDYVSVKLSSVASQISLTGYDQTIDTIKARLRSIYDAAIEGGRNGQPKFVNLDMEEYRDLHLTLDVFRAVLDEPDYERLEAGIVLQAYLPDSYDALQSLTEWALQRHARTGAGIKVRLVKGANLAMEQVEASLKEWPQAPYYNKLDVDANYKRMLEFATRPENAAVVKVGVASHNLFDIALAMLIRKRRDVESRVEFEMLEGMANAQALEVRQRTGDMLVYTPVCPDEEFESAIAYLVRRLDENTAPGSFLGALFALREGSPEWVHQKEAFLKAARRATDADLSRTPNRTQNRLDETYEPADPSQPFRNVSDTDFSLPHNRQWARQIYAKWETVQPDPVPIQVAGEDVTHDRLTGVGHDPSRPGLDVYQFAQGTAEDVDRALDCAVAAQPEWEQLGIEGRARVLRQVAVEFARGRADSIGCMLLDAGKAMMEADVEVSEAIDFANYYAQSLERDGWFDGTEASAHGVVVVTPPWNFPYAIPAGGVLAALAAGNSVILKPARESVLVARHLAEQLWRAGVPRNVLQFLPLIDGATGKKMITDPRVATVILTGSIFTAQMFQSWRPGLRLLAETSGKNAMIITLTADLDLAIKDLVRGAFGHAGQKCSATSLALIVKEVYDDPRFMAQLKDAAESLVVAGSWNPSATVTPVIREPDEYLKRGLCELDPGESWLLEPKMMDNNPNLWRPGIRTGVVPGSWYCQTECFGPVLGLVRVDSLEQAIEIQNSSEFGLTGGLHALDPVEIALWREKVEVGNAYINRVTTGAIVQRQPFGGWKKSCVGPGPKAGGPNYVSAFCQWRETDLPSLRDEPDPTCARIMNLAEEFSPSPEDRQRLKAAAENYAYWWKREFSLEHDPSHIHGETNHFRYRPRPWHCVRTQSPDDPSMALHNALVAMGAAVTGMRLLISIPAAADWAQRLADLDFVEVAIESDEQLAQRLAELRDGTLRILGPYDDVTFAPAVIGNIPIVDPTPLANGRIELLKYLREQSVSQTVHRYGNIL